MENDVRNRWWETGKTFGLNFWMTNNRRNVCCAGAVITLHLKSWVPLKVLGIDLNVHFLSLTKTQQRRIKQCFGDPSLLPPSSAAEAQVAPQRLALLIAQKICKLYKHDNPSVFPATISKLLLGYALCQLKSWISQTCLMCGEMPDYKAFTARGKACQPCGLLWQNLFLPQNGENTSVTQVRTWSPTQRIPSTSHPSHNSLGPPISRLLPGRLIWGHSASHLHEHPSLLPLRAPPHLPLIPPAKWLHLVIPVCSDYSFPSLLLKQAKDRAVFLPYSPSPALWLSCKKPVGCCTWSRTVNIPFIMEGGICCKGQRRQELQGKKLSFSLPHCCCLLKMFSTGKFHSLPPPTFSYQHSPFVGVFSFCVDTWEFCLFLQNKLAESTGFFLFS